MITFLFFMGLLLAVLIMLLAYEKVDIVKCLLLGISVYFALYIAASGLLVWVDFFSLKKAAALTVLIQILIIAAQIFIASKRIGQLTAPLIRYLYILPILVASFFITANKSGMYCTSQDEGLYQAKALSYIGYNNDNKWDFDEYYNVINNYEKQLYLESLDDMDGYYLDDSTQDDVTDGVLHGVNTFPAVLALWGWCFGVTSIPAILTLFYVVAVSLLFYICENLGFKHFVSVLMATMMAFCPIVIWCAQNTLTEILLTMLVTSFFVFITENEKRKMSIYSALPLVGACFLHVLITVLMPMFVCIYLISHIFNKGKDKGAIGALVAVLVSYAMGLTMMYSTAHRYIYANFAQLFQKTGNLLNDDNLVAVVWIMCIVLSAVLVIVDRLKGFKALRRALSLKKQNGRFVTIFAIVISLIVVLVTSFFIFKGLKVVSQDMMVVKMGIMGYLIMSGYIMLPLAFIGIIVNAKKLLSNRRMLFIYFSLLYVVLMYGGVLMVLIYYYFYYARYLAPFMILVFMAAGFILNKLKIYVVVPVVAFVTYLVISQSTFIYENKDVTYISYEQMSNVASHIGEGDAVLIREEGYHLHRIFMLPLKGLTRCDIYFVNPDAFASQIFDITSTGMYENIYVLTYKDSFGKGMACLDKEYEATLNISNYDTFVEDDSPLPYANRLIDDYEQTVILYKVVL